MKNLQNGSEIVALLTKLQEQVVALDRKVDMLLSRGPLSRNPSQHPPAGQPSTPPPALKQEDRQKGRQMYQAVCADCQKDCQLPFKPNGDRPVYCQDCFRQRKTVKQGKGAPENRVQEVPLVETVVSAAPEVPVKEKKKAVPAKKPAPKKKVVPKKKSK